MEFEWDEDKAASNLDKHGVSFDYASRVFLDVHRSEFEDLRFQYNERRFAVLGYIDSRLFHVVYTWRNHVCRLISARKASRREQTEHKAL